MIDIMSQDEELRNKEDLEDGELLEEGEVSDGEEKEDETQKVPESGPSSTPGAPGVGVKAAPLKRGPFAARRPSKPVDFDSKTERERVAEVWGGKLSPKNEHGDRDYRSAEDTDYRNPFEGDAASNEFGDTDYRDRRRRRSPSPEGGFDRPMFKKFRGGFAGRGRGGFRGRPFMNDTAHVICKFYREGYCRDADHCAFSHLAEDSLRRPELCKFYQNGFCKKGLHCSNLHGEFPCISFHRGECEQENCGYSHLPLTEYTRPIFEKYNAEEDKYRGPARRPMQSLPGDVGPPPPHSGAEPMPYPPVPPHPAAVQPGAPMRPFPPGLPMPPGFPGGPPAGTPVPPGMGPPISAVAGASSPHGIAGPPRRVLIPGHPGSSPSGMTPGRVSPDQPGGLPPPSVVVPQLGGPPRSTGAYPAPGFGSPFYGAPNPITASPKTEEPSSSSSTAGGFNISQMLAQFAGPSTSSSVDVDESPASPPPQDRNASLTAVRPIRAQKDIVWRLVPVTCPAAYSTVDPNVASQCPQSDPRLPKLLSSQFDAVSSLISSSNPVPSALPPPKLVDPRPLTDPRLRPSAAAGGADAKRGSWMPTLSNS